MQYRKNGFSQTLPEQRPRWTSSKNISFRSFRFLFYWNFFVVCALSGLNWHRNRAFSGSSRLKSRSIVENINPGNQKMLFPLLIAGGKFERELNLNFWPTISLRSLNKQVKCTLRSGGHLLCHYVTFPWFHITSVTPYWTSQHLLFII